MMRSGGCAPREGQNKSKTHQNGTADSSPNFANGGFDSRRSSYYGGEFAFFIPITQSVPATALMCLGLFTPICVPESFDAVPTFFVVLRSAHFVARGTCMVRPRGLPYRSIRLTNPANSPAAQQATTISETRDLRRLADIMATRPACERVS